MLSYSPSSPASAFLYHSIISPPDNPDLLYYYFHLFKELSSFQTITTHGLIPFVSVGVAKIELITLPPNTFVEILV